jgi:regulator of RNase E activity RraA
MSRSGFGSEDQLSRRISEVEKKARIVGQVFTVATVPAAAQYKGIWIYVSNGAAGSPVMAFSNGTNWLRCDTLAVIS